MKMSIVLFAGAIFASSMPAAGTNPMNCAKHVCCRPAGVKAATTADPGAQERFRMKFGRTTKPEVNPSLLASATDACGANCCTC